MKSLMLLVLVVAAFGANSLATGGVALNAHPQPLEGGEFYWDDGIMSSGWVWYTGGNYWGVQFDEVKTGGYEYNGVTSYGAVTYPDWPDSTFQGCYMHTFDDLGGYPGDDLGHEFLQFTQGGVFQWVDTTTPVGAVFYIAFQQVGNYPSADSIGVDAVAGTHNWTGYHGSWSPTTLFGDFMLRCYWEPLWGVEETSWGAVKALY